MLEVTCKAGDRITLTYPAKDHARTVDRKGADPILLVHPIVEPGNLRDVEPFPEGGGDGHEARRPVPAAMAGE